MSRVFLAALCALCLLPSVASAAKISIAGAPAPGPAKYDKVTAWTYGPSSAKTVLVIVPGTSGGAGSVVPVAKDLASRVKGVQVWAYDRREEAFEDQSGFASGDPDKALDYYLGFKYQQPQDASYVGDWGLAVQTEDLRRVVRRASDGGKRKVVLAGHSRGASQVVAYAAWDFAGRPGYRDLAGMVLIDGGLLGFTAGTSTQPLTADQAQAQITRDRGKPFNDAIGIGIPAIAQIFGQLVGTYADKRPDDRSALQDNALIPAALRPAFPVTNEAFLGNIFDKTTSPESFRSLRTRSGDLSPGGDPRTWVSGERTPIERFAKAWASRAPDFAEWYFPQRLITDISAAESLRRGGGYDTLGLRLFHAAKIDTPLYAFQTDLTGGRVLTGARRLAARSKIRDPKLVDATATMSHLDPVLAAPEENSFARTLAPWLRSVVRGEKPRG